MQKRIKSLLLAAGTVACLALGCIGGRMFAYYSDTATETNTVRMWKSETTEIEQFDPGPFDTTKKVMVKNTGENDCFVRVRLSWSNEQIKAYATEKINTTDWEYVASENFYYYRGILGVGATTPALLESFSISKTIPYELQEAYAINVYQESVNTLGLDASQYKSAWSNRGL